MFLVKRLFIFKELGKRIRASGCGTRYHQKRNYSVSLNETKKLFLVSLDKDRFFFFLPVKGIQLKVNSTANIYSP